MVAAGVAVGLTAAIAVLIEVLARLLPLLLVVLVVVIVLRGTRRRPGYPGSHAERWLPPPVLPTAAGPIPVTPALPMAADDAADTYLHWGPRYEALDVPA